MKLKIKTLAWSIYRNHIKPWWLNRSNAGHW